MTSFAAVPGLEQMADARLITHIRDAITAAQRRPAIAGEVKALIFAIAAEYKMEFLAGSDLTPAEIVATAETGVQGLVTAITRGRA